MGNPVTRQFVGDDLPGGLAVSSYQSAEKPLGCAGVTPVLEKNVNEMAILVDGAPQVSRPAMTPQRDRLPTGSVVYL